MHFIDGKYPFMTLNNLSEKRMYSEMYKFFFQVSGVSAVKILVF